MSTKPTLKKKTATPAPKIEKAVEAAPVAKKKVERESVLIEYTANELIKLIGADTKVQVGRKSLKAIQTALVLAKAGI